MGDDRPVLVRDHPGVLGQVDPRHRPLVADEVGVDVGLADIGEIVGEQHLGDTLDVIERGWPDLVAIGEPPHARSLRGLRSRAGRR